MCLTGVIGLVVVGAWFVANDDPVSEPTKPEWTPQSAVETRTPSALAGYVGSHVCAECHPGVDAEYHHSPMSQSWGQVDEVSVEELPHSDGVEDSHGPFQYRALWEEGHLVQRETLPSEGLAYERKVPAAYFVGSGNHARALVAEENGYLTQMPLAWFSGKGEWQFNPGYELKNHRFERPILPGCIACHGGQADHLSPSKNRYRLPISDGIGCERCHGPGKEHVAYRKERHAKSEAAGQPDPIINPQKLAPGLANDVCLQCHLQGDVVVYQPGAEVFSFRPGEKLSAHRLDFLVQTDEPEAFGVASHGARLLQSRCFLESGKTLTCIHCHDAHQPVEALSSAAYDAKCTMCHQPTSCSRPEDPRQTRTSEGCVACHMPRRSTREGQHLVFTDHRIRRSPSDENPDPNPPLLKPNSPVELLNFSPEADPHQARLGSAYVLLHETMGPQLPSLERGIALLEQALQKSPADEQSRYWLASGEIARYHSQEAIGHLRRLLEAKPNWHKARFRLAVAYHQSKLYREAIAEYEHVIQAVPDWMEPYPLVVRLHLAGGNPQAALRLAKQQLSYRKDATAYVNLALAKRLTGEPMKACQSEIDQALRLDPRLIVAHTTQAWFFAQAGDRTRAIASYQRALAIDPENQEAKAGLQALK